MIKKRNVVVNLHIIYLNLLAERRACLVLMQFGGPAAAAAAYTSK